MSRNSKQISRRAAVIAVASAMGMSLVACGTRGPASGQRVSSSALQVMSVAQARVVMKGFDTRLNAAIAKGIGPVFDEDAWRAVNADEMLARNIYETRIFKAAGDSRPDPTWHHKVTSVLGRTRSGGRDTVVVRGDSTFHQGVGGRAKAHEVSYDAVWVMERTSSSAEWKLSDQISLEDVTLPRRKGPRAASSAPMRPPAAVVGAVIDGFELDRFDGLRAGAAIRNTKKMIGVDSDVKSNYSCYPRSTNSETTTVHRDSPDIVMLTSRRPMLMVLRLRCDVDHWALNEEFSLTVPSAQAKVDGLPHSTVHAPEGYAMTVLLSVPVTGQSAVLAVSPGRVLRKGAPHPLDPTGRPA